MVDMNLGHHSKVHKGQGGLTIKPPVGYDLYADVFHIYLAYLGTCVLIVS